MQEVNLRPGPASRVVGRPRALTLDEVLDAAIALGLTGINMPALATQLGIGTATLYNYVRSRDDLVRLASLRQAGRLKFRDFGPDWRSTVHAMATAFFQFFTSEPHLLDQYMQGAIGPDTLVDYLEAFLAAMARHGFNPDDAYRIFATANTVVFGAVVRANYLKAFADKGIARDVIIKRAMLDRDAAALPHLRACATFSDEAHVYDFEDTLRRVIESFAGEFKGKIQE